ncbi:MAG: hypothetical protein A2Y10_12035 [Planctomycetes bacterium GWF2_41_51]|nr:MAG: hypothetical protein A2Y10_12035 [Planctomycetes bacterium GWF2_41_51]HBG28675.1 hypothetical protein [Phycisphaerales bacterium]
MDVVKIIKKNMAIIIPAVIAAAALLLLIPSVMLRGKISNKLEESASLGRSINSMLNTIVSSRQPEIEKKHQDSHEIDANQIDKLAMQTTQRELLSYKIFPDPNETSMQIFNEFKREYNTAFAGYVKNLKALDAPTDNEIRKLAGSVTISAGNESYSPGTKGDDKIVELICKSRSQEIPVYANPWVFSGYAFWDNWEYKGTESAVKDCWYCQLACWIHQDVIDTINSINAGSSSVDESSVKRLLSVKFTEGTRDSGLDLPVYVNETVGGLCQPWTGRKCNEKIDVVHFKVSAIVRADDVLKFMSALCSEKEHNFAGYKGELSPEKYKHNQITVLESSITPVDRNSAENKRYYYGSDAVVSLDLICEYVFNRQGYDVIKPQSISDDIAGTSSTGSPSYDSGNQGGGYGMPGMPGGMQ